MYQQPENPKHIGLSKSQNNAILFELDFQYLHVTLTEKGH